MTISTNVLMPLGRAAQIVVLASAALLFVVSGRCVLGADRAGSPEDVVRGLADSAIAILSDETLAPESRDARFHELLSRHFDLEVISRFVLGTHWKRATSAERREYRRLYEAYILGFYVSRLNNYSGESVTINSTRLQGGNRAVVASEIQAPSGEAFRVDWRLRRGDEGWHVVDLVVEGVSLAITQRAEFDSVIRSSRGIEGLLVKLREITA